MKSSHPHSSFFILHSKFFILLALLLGAGLSAFAKEPPPTPTQWFTDEAGLVSSSDAAALNEKLRAFEQSSGAQFIIYVFKSLDGDPLEDFTVRCAEKWKVGNKKYDNGLILFVFVQERKFRIEVGYGLEGAVTDAFSSDVLR
ncbi:MAG TPA: TPM domain-containing protein, partial [Thermoanaerobaculia bacterium]|nr:TPM domain-containing protein [Thermoanaerobaculia bacterium]